MSDEIRPALTPDEWAHYSQIRPTGPNGIRFGFTIKDPDVPGRLYTVMPKDEHKVAALCLYGQPFGFTHEELRKLREVSDWWSYFDQGQCPRCQHGGFKIPARPICTSCGWQPAFHTDEVLEAVTAIAEKISALLPPDSL